MSTAEMFTELIQLQKESLKDFSISRICITLKAIKIGESGFIQLQPNSLDCLICMSQMLDWVAPGYAICVFRCTLYSIVLSH